MTNEILAQRVILAIKKIGVRVCCVCPGSRNSPLVVALDGDSTIHSLFWYEERSAAFFAMGRCKRDSVPVAVITTSGTAVAEMLPAAMESYYAGVPLLLITADRPRRFRHTGAPQTAEQLGIYGQYATACWDIALDEPCDLSNWNLNAPAHLNVCFEEPNKKRGIG